MAQSEPDDLKARIKNSYDAIANNYADYTNTHDASKLLHLEILLTQLRKSPVDTLKVLELGCGSGVPATKYMLETDKPIIHVTANELSTTQLNLAKTNLASYNDRLTLVEGDMMALSYPEGTFDAITGFYSIIHLPRKEQTELIGRIAKWLKPSGLLLANFATEESDAMVDEKWLGHGKGWMYWSAWGEEGSVKMIEDAGFKIINRDTTHDAGDAKFVWLIAKKGT